MKASLYCALMCSAFVFHSPAALAQHKAHETPTAKKSNAASELSSGELRKLDLKAGKLTIKHGELSNLGMPPMTMVFGLKKGLALPAGLKEGDKLRFRAEEIGGQLVLTALEIQR